MKRHFLFIPMIFGFLFVSGQTVTIDQKNTHQGTTFSLVNERITFSITFKEEKITGDSLFLRRSIPSGVLSDGNFGLDLMWADWSAPGRMNNADNQIILDNQHFRFVSHSIRQLGESKELDCVLKGEQSPLLLKITYRIDPDRYYIRKKISVCDTIYGAHFLHSIFPVSSQIQASSGDIRIIKKGEFGQPVAFTFGNAGFFAGLEYPAATNHISAEMDSWRIACGQEIGEKIGNNWVSSEWVVMSLTPDKYVENWFYKYVDDIRIVPIRPYALYNSWYDLRAPEYPGVKPENVMNEKNILQIVNLFKKNMIDKHHLQLDAFVLDDGWDIYESDWVLRKKEFPRGLKPVRDELTRLGTDLGIWFGPTGGYSFRMKRIDWMKKNGYEVVGKTKHDAMLCLGGKKYGDLFRKRTTDFVKNDGVKYFKWDGIQFSCSEPDHGHPVGLYSRRAILESVIEKCKAVRETDPSVYLNITSGTWLSPWWVKYANQIWMQGADYGYADVPVISQRDGAITYRDFILYDDLRQQEWWFPVSNLMTHGIIKGNLERLGGEDDPIHKFTDDVVLYFGRGVSMYELYISPDLLTDGEWDAIGKSMNWAKDRFPVLRNTYMVGGNPMNREPYGYVHFEGQRGIVAARNPYIDPSYLTIRLDPAYNLDPHARSLVLEMVYPYHWISPDLFTAGSIIDIPLEGYETAIFEIYPLREASKPLLAGIYSVKEKTNGNVFSFEGFNPGLVKLLNPEKVTSVKVNDRLVEGTGLIVPSTQSKDAVTNARIKTTNIKNTRQVQVSLNVSEEIKSARLYFLIRPDKAYAGQVFPDFKPMVDGQPVTPYKESQEGDWAWVSVDLTPGTHEVNFSPAFGKRQAHWVGHAEIWFIGQQQMPEIRFEITASEQVKEQVMPPMPFRDGLFNQQLKVGEGALEIRLE